MRIKDGLTV